MLAALLGAIEGQVTALDAVLAAIDDEGILTVIATGNYLGGPASAHVLPALRQRDALLVQGAQDRLLVRLRRKPATARTRLTHAQFDALDAAYATTPSTDLETLRALPRVAQPSYEGRTCAIAHGALNNTADVLDADTPDERFVRQREQVPADLIVLGGAPAFHTRTLHGTLFVCCGPVAASPMQAAWVRLDTDALTAQERRVPVAG